MLEENIDEALLDACLEGNTESALYLIEEGISENAKDYLGWTPLHCACIYGHLETSTALVDKGATVNEKDDDGDTPLHMACINGHLETSIALVDRGGNVNEKNNEGRTSLHIASRYNHIDTALMLIHKGADIFASDTYGRTCLDDYAASQSSSAADTEHQKDKMRREFYWTRRKSYAMFLSSIKTLTQAESPPLMRNITGMQARAMSKRVKYAREILVKDEAFNCQDIQRSIVSYL